MSRNIDRVSQLDNLPGRYVVGCDTPDGGRSTYAECWGSTASHSERGIYSSDSLADAVARAEAEGFIRRVTDDGRVVTTDAMHATVYDRTTGREVGKAKIAVARKLAAK